MENVRLKSDRIEAALTTALEGGSTRALFELLERASGMPGPRPALDALKAFGARIASEGKAGEDLVGTLLESQKTSLYYVGVMAVGARAARPDGDRSLAELMELADETSKERRDAVIEALVVALAARGDKAARVIRPLADGYLHAYVALEALTHPRVIERLQASSVLDVLSEAFAAADDSPRAAERTQGLRLLREGFPKQIAKAAVRYPEAIDFIRERSTWERPETRDILTDAIRGLRKILGEADADKLRLELESHAKVPRYEARIVKGTRKRSRGR